MALSAIPQDEWYPPLMFMWLPAVHIGHFVPLKMLFCWVVRPWAQGYIYSILTTWKCDYSSVIRPSTYRYLAFTKPLFGLLVAWKWESSRVKRLLVEELHGSLPLTKPLYGILGAWKWHFSMAMRPSTHTYIASTNLLSAIWCPENDFFKFNEYLGWRIHGFRWATLRNLGSLKEAIPAVSLFPLLQCNWLCQHMVQILATWKYDFSSFSSFFKLFKGNFELLISILVAWK